MFFTECAHLAERHPELAVAIEAIDAQLGKLGTAEVVRAGDWASFLGIDPNQVSAVLEKLAQEGVLRKEEMVECAYCRMAVLRSEYLELLEEDGEYRCTSCERPLTDATGEAVTTYRRGEKWTAATPEEGSDHARLAGIQRADEQRDDLQVFDFTPTPEDLEILRAHRDAPTTLTQVALEAATRITRKTVGARLKELEQRGLVHRPHPKKGTALTEAGRTFLQHLDQKRAGSASAGW